MVKTSTMAKARKYYLSLLESGNILLRLKYHPINLTTIIAELGVHHSDYKQPHELKNIIPGLGNMLVLRLHSLIRE